MDVVELCEASTSTFSLFCDIFCLLFILHFIFFSPGNTERMKKFKICIEDPPRRKHMVFLGGSVLADIMKVCGFCLVLCGFCLFFAMAVCSISFICCKCDAHFCVSPLNHVFIVCDSSFFFCFSHRTSLSFGSHVRNTKRKVPECLERSESHKSKASQCSLDRMVNEAVFCFQIVSVVHIKKDE